MSDHWPPPGFALIRVGDLAQLLAARQQGNQETRALAAVVAILTGYQIGEEVDLAEILADSDPVRVVGLLTVMTATLLRSSFDDHGAGILRDLGEEAAKPAPP